MLKIPHLLVGFVFLFASNISAFAESKPPPAPTPRTESQTPQAETKSDQGASKDNQRGTEDAPLVIKIIPTEKTNNEADNPAANQQQQPFGDWGRVFPTWVLAFMAFIANGFSLWLVISSNKAREREFRAYIIGVALFGVPKGPHGPREQYRAKASDYTGPWRLMIHNFGKTPGVILKVEWGRCPIAEFPVQTSVSDIIDSNLLPNRMQPTVIGMNEMCLPSAEPAAYRHAELPERVVGEVLFGRITFKDIFRKTRHSTFAILNQEEHTDTIGMSLADDWS